MQDAMLIHRGVAQKHIHLSEGGSGEDSPVGLLQLEQLDLSRAGWVWRRARVDSGELCALKLFSKAQLASNLNCSNGWLHFSRTSTRLV